MYWSCEVAGFHVLFSSETIAKDCPYLLCYKFIKLLIWEVKFIYLLTWRQAKLTDDVWVLDYTFLVYLKLYLNNLKSKLWRHGQFIHLFV